MTSQSTIAANCFLELDKTVDHQNGGFALEKSSFLGLTAVLRSVTPLSYGKRAYEFSNIWRGRW
jgi:hypothetical protein